MLEIDFTSQAIPVEEVLGPGLIHLTTGYDPDHDAPAGDPLHQEYVAHLDSHQWLEPEAGATTTSKAGGTMSKYIVRERTITHPGVYEVKGSFRRGSSRVFILDVAEDSIIVKSGSASAYWVVGDLDPIKNDPAKDMLIYVSEGLLLVQHVGLNEGDSLRSRLETEDLKRQSGVD